MRVPSTQSEEELAIVLLEEDDVLVHPGFFFDFAERVSFGPESSAGAGDVRRRRAPDPGARRWMTRSDHGSPRGRHAGVIAPLFSIPSRSSWGIGEIADLPRLGALARGGGPRLRAAAADQRDARRPELAVFGAERDGHRSDFHRRRRRWSDFRGCRRTERARAPKGGARSRRRAARRRFTIRRCAPSRRAPFGSRSTAFAANDLQTASERGRVPSALTSSGKAGGCDTYALFRALHDEHGGRYWREWDEPLRDRHPEALDAARARLGAAVRYYQYLQWIADGSGGARARRAGRSACSATFRSWSTATAPTCGRASTSSISTRRSACRRSAVADGGTGLGPARVPLGRRRAATATVARASAPGDARSCSTRSASIISWASIGPSSASDDRTPVLLAARTSRRRSRRARTLMALFRRHGRLHHRRGSRDRAGLRPRVAGQAGRAGAEGAALGA